MGRLKNQELLSVLVKAYNTTLTDYYYFPEVVFAGRHRIERELFDHLRHEELVTPIRHDSFGRFYTLTQKAEQMIYAHLVGRAGAKRKREVNDGAQARFCF